MVEFAEIFSIKSSTHNYNFEGIRRICGGFALAVLRRVSELLDCFEIRDEQVRPQGPFVRLIDDNDAVAAQHGIRHEFANDHSVREIFYFVSTRTISRRSAQHSQRGRRQTRFVPLRRGGRERSQRPCGAGLLRSCRFFPAQTRGCIVAPLRNLSGCIQVV